MIVKISKTVAGAYLPLVNLVIATNTGASKNKYFFMLNTVLCGEFENRVALKRLFFPRILHMKGGDDVNATIQLYIRGTGMYKSVIYQ